MRIFCSLGTLLRIGFWLVLFAVMLGVSIAHPDLPQP